MADLSVWTVDGDAPRRVDRSGVDLEKDLEDWIAADASLLAGGITIVGRQVQLDGGALDLLAFDGQDRWVVIEIKRGRLYRDALAQALDYSSSIAALGADELRAKLQSDLVQFGDPEELSRNVQRLLKDEGERREVAVLLVGVGVDSGLERIADFLGSLGVSVRVVSFEVFEPDGGPRLLIREVTEEQDTPQPGPTYVIEALHQRALEAGVAAQFGRLVQMSEKAGLAVRPYKVGVKIAHTADRRWRLVWANPRDGGIFIGVDPAVFARFFPSLTEEAVTAAIGLSDNWRDFEGAELDARLDQIEAFLNTLPSQDGDSE